MLDKNKILKIELQEYYNEDYIKLMICCTNVCNYNCYYCYNKKNRQLYNNTFINFNNLFNFINAIYKSSNTKIVLELLGGEPTLHPDLLNFCISANNIDYIIDVIIYSNLTCSLDYINKYKFLKKIHFEFSYHSVNDKINNNFIKKLTYINKKQILENYSYGIMYEKKNIENSIFVYNFLNLLKIKHGLLILEYIINEDCYKQKTLNTYYTKSELAQYKILSNKYLNLTRENNSIKIYTVDNIYQISHNDFVLLQIDPYNKCICDSGYKLFYIDFIGDIYHCEALSNNKNYIYGNIKNFNCNKIVNKENIKICKSHICSFQNRIYQFQ